MTSIRPYKESDYETICSWWKAWGEIAPLPGMMIEDGTFVLEHQGKAAMTLTVLKTQTKEIAYFEGYCKAPELDSFVSRGLGELLWNHGYQYLKDNGFKRVIAFTDKTPLRNRYSELGMEWISSDLFSLGKVL